MGQHLKTRLSFEDFRRVVRGKWQAEVHCDIKYKVKIESIDSFLVDLSFEVWNELTEGTYMIKNPVDSLALLNHEQGHLDVCVIHTLRLTQRLKKREYFALNFKSDIERIFLETQNQQRRMDINYDLKTNHGLNDEGQMKWDSLLRSHLRSLMK